METGIQGLVYQHPGRSSGSLGGAKAVRGRRGLCPHTRPERIQTLCPLVGANSQEGWASLAR